MKGCNSPTACALWGDKSRRGTAVRGEAYPQQIASRSCCLPIFPAHAHNGSLGTARERPSADPSVPHAAVHQEPVNKQALFTGSSLCFHRVHLFNVVLQFLNIYTGQY
jgi:hypothetical protein